MLAPMNGKGRAQRAFTLIEMMVTIAIATILLAIAVPSMRSLIAKKRVESIASELGTDLQYARTEAVARNAPVRMTFGTGCYVIHTHPAGAGATSCAQSGASTIGASAIEIKTVQMQSGADTSLSPTAGFVEFDPVRGDRSATDLSDPPTLSVASSASNWQLAVCVNRMGRPATYSPSGSGHIQGYPATCPAS